MDLRGRRHGEQLLVKTKIVATVGPACATAEKLRELVTAGVDVVRLNFAHGTHEWLGDIVNSVREISRQLNRPIGVLGDLSGPKIRLGKLPDDKIHCPEDAEFEFIRGEASSRPDQLTCTYEKLIDDVRIGDRVLLADGTVSMRVIEQDTEAGFIRCKVEGAGTLRSRQGVNLPGVALSAPSLTEKDRDDLNWALDNELDFIGLSFVRQASDIEALREAIRNHGCASSPHIVAKIEKAEAVADLEAIIEKTDVVMVARGDLGVEVDIAQVPVLQKRIIRLCNRHRIPVITATQMLDSMQTNERPTRAEAGDVANAVLDGTDAVMLSGETAIGDFPVKAVSMMNHIAHEAERILPVRDPSPSESRARTHALLVTEAVTLGAGAAAEHLRADLIVVATHSGRTAMSVSDQRSRVPIVALSDLPATARRMCLYWGVTSIETSAVHEPPAGLLKFVVDWGRKEKVLSSGSRLVLVASTNWSAEGHDIMLVHVVP